MINLGEQFQAQIETCAFGGDGIARPNGVTVFVPGTLPGETVVAEVTDVRSNFARARVLRFGQRSAGRIEPVCPHAGKCAGCAYGHCTYELENQLKLDQLRHFPGAAEIDPGAPLAPEPVWNYRNKLVLHVRKPGPKAELGYVGPDGASLRDIDSCLLARPEINEKLRELRSNPGFDHTLHDGMELTLRFTEHDGVRYWRNAPGAKIPMLTEETPLGPLAVPAGSFFQINRGGMELLLGLVGDALAEKPRPGFLDLYCGAGLFGCLAARRGVPKILGTELDKAAAEAARLNLRRCGAHDFAVAAAEAGHDLPELLSALPPGSPVLVDPPRTGLPAGVVRALNNSRTPELFYISCHPATWSRDAGRLTAAGWVLCELRMVNMFPRTAHFELYSRFQRT